MSQTQAKALLAAQALAGAQAAAPGACAWPAQRSNAWQLCGALLLAQEMRQLGGRHLLGGRRLAQLWSSSAGMLCGRRRLHSLALALHSRSNIATLQAGSVKHWPLVQTLAGGFSPALAIRSGTPPRLESSWCPARARSAGCGNHGAESPRGLLPDL